MIWLLSTIPLSDKFYKYRAESFRLNEDDFSHLEIFSSRDLNWMKTTFLNVLCLDEKIFFGMHIYLNLKLQFKQWVTIDYSRYSMMQWWIYSFLLGNNLLIISLKIIILSWPVGSDPICICSRWTLDTAPCVFVLVLMNNFYLVLTLMSGWLGATSKWSSSNSQPWAGWFCWSESHLRAGEDPGNDGKIWYFSYWTNNHISSTGHQHGTKYW